MNGQFILGLLIGIIAGPILVVLVFLFVAVGISWIDRKPPKQEAMGPYPWGKP